MPSGKGIFSDVARLKVQVDEHEKRLNHHDDEIAEIDADVRMLSEICARSHLRAAARLRLKRIRARRSK